jgi:hypothetical protein
MRHGLHSEQCRAEAGHVVFCAGVVGQAAGGTSAQPAGPPGEQAGEDDEDLDIQLETEAEDALAQQGSEVGAPS